jgi:hypothetical protein
MGLHSGNTVTRKQIPVAPTLLIASDSNDEIADWWPKSDRGLSGGQIAGIVVCSSFVIQYMIQLSIRSVV